MLNVNGHETVKGKAADYKQIRCINQAKRGMLALNVEWFGMGQLNTPGFTHYKMNQLDLTGSSGIAPFYLAMTRALDLLLALDNADPERVAVTGLSGGGWQTIFISSLDERVTLADAVAGYSSFVTRTQFPEFDLGDSEQTPSDLATVVDYAHLTAMRAPRPTLLTYNARDSCCFRAEWALAPLLQDARPIYRLFDREYQLRQHINEDAGHNYGKDNREALYRMLRDFFYGGGADFDVKEIPVDDELKTAEQLAVELPADNLDFHKLAVRLAEGLPRTSATESSDQQRGKLREVTKTPQYAVDAELLRETEGHPQAAYWKLHMGDFWTVPAVELRPAAAAGTVIVVADGGRTAAEGDIRRLLSEGKRVIALDPFYFGESKIETEDFLFAILVAAVGERPLGIQAGQIAATARWAKQLYGDSPTILAIGPRTSLAALIASALEPDAVAGARVIESFRSMREVIAMDLGANQTPELFCFGLLEQFDIPQIAELSKPRNVAFAKSLNRHDRRRLPRDRRLEMRYPVNTGE